MQRKLAAILSADVVGYSGLMEADEAGTLDGGRRGAARAVEGRGGLNLVAGSRLR